MGPLAVRFPEILAGARAEILFLEKVPGNPTVPYKCKAFLLLLLLSFIAV
jgi:hypothetical protein